ncbi:putative methylesterase 14, chloroplastic [Capsicum baccatum]|uniref:Methylesterase 14, chloroplastic n=1 Tax=Capsicum baccatum TaxID=33114 RepID=A0A2G2WKS1_CAPBA|nr:putative methylesterase 14, chloroplastic [Capsicum baccatum]
MERSKRRSLLEEEFFHRLALSLAIQQHQLSQRFDGSISKRIGSTSSHRRSDLPEHLSNSKQWDYSKPLIDYLENFPGDEKCWRCLCFLCLRAFPTKIAKAVFICAMMISDGQRPFDVFAEELRSAELFTLESKFLTYGKWRSRNQAFCRNVRCPRKACEGNPPEGVFKIKGSDHSSFFSKTESRHEILVEIVQIP